MFLQDWCNKQHSEEKKKKIIIDRSEEIGEKVCEKLPLENVNVWGW